MEKENSDLAPGAAAAARGDGTPTPRGGVVGGSIKEMFEHGVKAIETQRCVREAGGPNACAPRAGRARAGAPAETFARASALTHPRPLLPPPQHR